MSLLGAMIALSPLAAKGVISVLGAALGVFALILCWHHGWRTKTPALAITIFLGLVILVGASALWAVNPATSLEGAGRTVIIGGLGLAMITAANQGRFLSMSRALGLMAAVTIGITLTIFLQVTAFAPIEWIAGKDGVPLYYANKAIGLLALITPVLLWPVFYSGTRAQKMLATLVVGLLLWMVAAGEGQSSLLALLIFAIAAALPVGSVWFFRTCRILLIAGVMSMPLIMLAIYPAIDVLAQSAFMRTASAPQRLEVWSAIAKKILDAPVLGHGYNAARYIKDLDNPGLYQPGTQFSHPHNLALQLWLEYGIIGAALGTAALAAILRAIFQAPILSVRRLWFASFAAVLSVSMIGWGMWQAWWMVLIAVLIAVNIMVGHLLADQAKQAATPTNSPVTS